MFKRLKIDDYEIASPEVHKEHQHVNTKVSEYLRKYGTGKIDVMPTDSRPELHDTRSVDEMLSDDMSMDHMSYDELDARIDMADNLQKYDEAFKEIELTTKQKEKFDAAVAVLNDKNSSYEQIKDAERILEELKEAGKLKRARV